MIDSELIKLMSLARLGFKVVPVCLKHPIYGTCLLEMDCRGFSVAAMNNDFFRYCTWDEIDNLVLPATTILPIDPCINEG